MKEYDVTITETLEMTVDYILDADHFKDVVFRAKDRSRDRGER